MTTKQLSREEILQQAHEAEAQEVGYLDQIKNLPGRVAEAKRAAEGRFAVQNAERLAGRSPDEPVLDFSEAQSILDSEDEIRASAKAAGIRKLKLLAALHNHDAELHRATLAELDAPLRDLEEQHARITNDLRAVRAARMAADKRHRDSWGAAQEYSRAARFAESANDPIRRM